ncbi:diguanylate cyclase [Candidatus Bipolaricaulota bacterium]
MGKPADARGAKKRQSSLSQFLALTPDQCYVLSRDARIEAVNDEAVEDLKTTRSALVSKQFHPMVAEGSQDSLSEMVSCLQESGIVRGGEISLRSDGETRTFSFSGMKLPKDVDDPEMYLLMGRDISVLAEKAKRNEYQALHDRLTGSYNRWYLEEILKREELRAMRYDHSIAFIMLDVDGFKSINDRHGHKVGDSALKWISDQLQSTLRESDFVVRLGGDEFLMVLPETDGEVTAVGSRVLEAVAVAGDTGVEPFLPMSVSIGSASWHPNDQRDIADALEEADRAMYEDRSRG